MHSTRFIRSTTLLASVLTTAIGASANAGLGWEYFAGGDAAFNGLTNNGALERAVTEGRIGNNGSSGTWEQGIWKQGGVGAPITQANFVWGNGAAVDFSISWNGSDTVSYTLGGQTLTYNTVTGPFTDIFIRTRSATDSSLGLTDLFLDTAGTDLNIGDLMSSGNGDVDYIRIRANGANFAAFTLSGKSTLTWDAGNQPNNSALAYQVKFSNVVPGPGALALFGLAGLAGSRRRRA